MTNASVYVIIIKMSHSKRVSTTVSFKNISEMSAGRLSFTVVLKGSVRETTLVSSSMKSNWDCC